MKGSKNESVDKDNETEIHRSYERESYPMEGHRKRSNSFGFDLHLVKQIRSTYWFPIHVACLPALRSWIQTSQVIHQSPVTNAFPIYS